MKTAFSEMKNEVVTPMCLDEMKAFVQSVRLSFGTPLTAFVRSPKLMREAESVLSGRTPPSSTISSRHIGVTTSPIPQCFSASASVSNEFTHSRRLISPVSMSSSTYSPIRESSDTHIRFYISILLSVLLYLLA